VSEAIRERVAALQAELQEERARRAAAERQLVDAMSGRLSHATAPAGAHMRLPGMDDESEEDLREFSRTSVFGDRDGTVDDELAKPRVFGTSEHNRDLMHGVLEEFADVLNPVLAPEGAKLPPFKDVMRPGGLESMRAFPMSRRFSEEKTDFMKSTTTLWLESLLIRDSQSQWCAPVHIARRNNTGALRMCCDYKRSGYNDAVEDMQYPMPTVDDIHRRLRGHRFLGKLDARSAYMQCLVDPETARWLAFSTVEGHFEPCRVPFGPKNAPKYFQWCMSSIVLKGLDGVAAYLDDIVLWADTEEEFRAVLRSVLLRCREYRIRLRGDKTELAREEIEVLGHFVSATGLRLSEERRQGVMGLREPTSGPKMRSFLAIAGYHRRYVRDFAIVTKCLAALTEKSVRWHWTATHQKAFDAVKQGIMDAPILSHVGPGPLFLATDACDIGCGGYLYQLDESGVELVVAYISYAFNAVERRWSTIEQEAFGIYYCVLKLEMFLSGRHFIVKTDHKNLLHMMQSVVPKVIRWRLRLQEFDFVVEHVAGVNNVVPDSLSRCFRIRIHPALWPTMVHVAHVPAAAAANGDNVSVIEDAADVEVEDDIIADAQDSDDDGEWRQWLADDSGDEADEELPGIGPEDPDLCAHAALTPQEAAAARRLACETIKIVHNAISGHLGVAATLRKLRDIGLHWNGMIKDVQRFVNACPICQKFKGKARQRGPAADLRVSGGIMQHLMVDSIGPIMQAEGGALMIIVIICRFSRWTECYASCSNTAEEAARVLIQHFGRYGLATTIGSDNGPQYDNRMIKELCRLLGLQQVFGPPNHSEAQATVERVNAEVMKHLRCITWNFGNYERWDELLPMAQRIINATVHSATGVAPATLVYGGRLDLDRRLLRPAVDYDAASLSEWAQDVLKAQEEMLLLSEHRNDAVCDYRTLLRGPAVGEAPLTFKAGDLVLVRPPHGKRPLKMAPMWLGPFVVLRPVYAGSTRWILFDVLGLPLNEHEYSVADMKPFAEPLWQAHVAPEVLRAFDACEVGVGEIVGHEYRPPLAAALGRSRIREGTRGARARLWLKVTWRAVQSPPDSWIPLEGNTQLAALKPYAKAHPEINIII
jgi:hypothetical protein